LIISDDPAPIPVHPHQDYLLLITENVAGPPGYHKRIKRLCRYNTKLQNIIVDELSISFLMWILTRIILIYEASFVTAVEELMSCVSSIVSEASFLECLNHYLQLVMATVHIVYKELPSEDQ